MRQIRRAIWNITGVGEPGLNRILKDAFFIGVEGPISRLTPMLWPRLELVTETARFKKVAVSSVAAVALREIPLVVSRKVRRMC
jgi:hypothetical protein